MKVREVMSTPVVTVDAAAPFAVVVERLLANDISGVPVVDDRGHVLGVVTEADLLANEAYGYRRQRALALIWDYLRGRDPGWVRKAVGRTARELMSAYTDSTSPDEELAVAARKMLELHRRRLPVLDEGRLVGIISRQDLLRSFHRSDEAIRADVEAVLADPSRIPESHLVEASVSDGVVSLTGSVLWPRDVALVEAMVARVPGVVAVHQRLLHREPEPRLPGPVQFG